MSDIKTLTIKGVDYSLKDETARNAIATYGDIVTHDVDEFATAAQGETADSALQPDDVIDDVQHTDTEKPLSARIGKVLQEQINNLNTRGKYLSIWNCTTGLAMDNPPVDPYTYETGSFFIVGVVASTGGTNYRPSGSTYSSSTPSTVVETESIKPNDTYYYDGTTWRLLATQGGGSVSFASLQGSPYDNTNLSNALNEKADTDDLATVATSGSYNDLSNKPTIPTNAIENTATGNQSLTILGTETSQFRAINIGVSSTATNSLAIALGRSATASGLSSLAVGDNAHASGSDATSVGSSAFANASGSIALGKYAVVSGAATNAVQIGEGDNFTANTLQFKDYQLVDASGKIPDDRLNTTIARTSQIPTVPTNVSAFTNDAGYQNATQVNTAISTHNTSSTAHSSLFSAKANDSDVVHKSGDETIADKKTFTGNILQIQNDSNTTLRIQDPEADYTTIPSAQRSRSIDCIDKNGKILGNFQFVRQANGDQETQILARNKTNGTQTSAYIRLGVKANGNQYAIAPVPTEDTTSSTQIDTVGARNTKINSHNSSSSAHSDIRTAVASKSTVSVSATGTATDEVQYITIDGVQKKLAGGGNIAVLTRAEYEAITTKDPNTTYIITDDLQGNPIVEAQILEALNTKQDILGDNVDYVIERQEPTAANNYTWYRKYKSGWVEQGNVSTDLVGSSELSITLPIEMQSTNYNLTVTQITDRRDGMASTVIPGGYIVSTNQIFVAGRYVQVSETARLSWQVSGMAA